MSGGIVQVSIGLGDLGGVAHAGRLFAHALAGFGNVKMSVLYTGLNVVVSENEILGLVSVYEENAVFKL